MAQRASSPAPDRGAQIIMACVVLTLASAGAALAPAIRCHMSGEPQDSSYAQVLTAPEQGGLSQCLSQSPPTRQRGPIGVGLLSVLVGAGVAASRRGAARAKRPASDAFDLAPSPHQALGPSSGRPPHRAPHTTTRIDAVKQLDRDVRGVGSTQVEAIELSQELELGTTAAHVAREREGRPMAAPTLMDMVAIQLDSIQESQDRSRVERVTLDGFYCPRRLLGKPVFYVDPRHPGASDEGGEDGGSLERPFRTIAAALRAATRAVRSLATPAQVRVQPGVYQEALKIPDRVSVLNHRLPGEGGPEEHLAWLMSQRDQVDHAQRVTILAPVHEPVAVRFEPGLRQGLYGCHVVSRPGVEQVGLGVERSTELTVRACVVSEFKLGGAQLHACGSDAPGMEVRFEGCAFLSNEALKGGALAIRDSVVAAHLCVFERNEAKSGGAIFASEPRGTLTITRSRFVKNRARHEQVPEEPAEAMALQTWFEGAGMGGAIGVERGVIKLGLCELRSNGATVAGGALALFSARALVQGALDEPSRLHGNRARAGGALFAVGRKEAPSTLKVVHASLTQNLGQSLGGGVCLIGMCTAQLAQSLLEGNVAQGQESLGGAIGAALGAQILGDGLTLRANKAMGAGAAIAARNASLRLRSSLVQDNLCEQGRAALYVESVSGARLDRLIAHGEVQIPFSCKLVEVELVGNRAAKAPSALFVGNMLKTPSLPIEVELERGVTQRGNRVEGQEVAEAVAILWAGERRMGQADLRPTTMTLG